MRRALGFLVAVLALAFGPAAASGQTDAPQVWTQAASATAEELWGVAWGGGQFVAVGKGGTIVTSPDGLTWTARQSGTNAWLLAVVHDAPRQRYFVAGDAGVLLTSTDAVSWTPLTSGTQQRLNGIAVGGGRILAVGENSTVVTSTDGQTWSVSQVAAPGWLRGVAYFDGAFVLGGRSYEDIPPVMPNYRTSDGVTFTEIEGTPFGYATEALAVYGDQVVALSDFVAVGPARFPVRVDRPYDPAPPLSRPVYGYFRGVALLDNRWIAAGSENTLMWGDVQGYWGARNAALDWTVQFNAVAANGAVAVAVGSLGRIVRTTAAGPRAPVVTTRAPVHQAVTTGAALKLEAGAGGSGPIGFQWYRNGTALAGAIGRTLTLAAATPTDSGLYTVSATNAFGTSTSTPHAVTVVSPIEPQGPFDPAFAPQIGADLLLGFEDGTLLLARTKPDYSQVLYRTDAAGRVDPSFQALERAAFGWAGSQPDGGILVLQQSQPLTRTALIRLFRDGTVDPAFTPIPRGSHFTVLEDGRILGFDLRSNVLRVQRYLRDGRVDPAYSGVELTLAPPPQGLSNVDYHGITITRDGAAWLVAVSASSRPQSSRILSFDAAGNYVREAAAFDFNIVQLVVTPTHLHYVTHPPPYGKFDAPPYLVGRMTRDFILESVFRPQEQQFGYITEPLLLPDGSLLDTSNRPRWYDAEGRQVPTPNLTSEHTVSELVVTPNGAIYGRYLRNDADGRYYSTVLRMLPLQDWVPTRLTNVSVRQQTGSGEGTLTLGLALSGNGTKSLLLRAVGPTLADFGVGGTLSDPALSLWNGESAQLLVNRDWWDAPAESVTAVTQAAARVGAFALRAQSRDAAALTSLAAGTYTLQVNTDSSSGVALAEAYDISPTPTDAWAARLVNVSARGLAGRGDQTLILGFAIEGRAAKRVLLRGVGPSLVPHGVKEVVADPIITVYRGDTVIAWNDGAASLTLGAEAGAFSLTSYKDAGIVLTLPSGVYTMQVTSADGASGIALAELYELP